MSFAPSSSEDLAEGPEAWFEGRKDENLELFVRSLPKVELHVHLDGCFDANELWDHLVQNPHLLQCFPVEKKLPWENPDTAKPVHLRDMVSACTTPVDYRRLCTCRRRYRRLRHADEEDNEGSSSRRSLLTNGQKVRGSLEDMLLCFEFFFPLVFDNFELLEHLAWDFVRRQHEQNVVYCEVRYSPHLLASDPRKSFHAVTRGLRKGCLEFSTVIVNQILCAISFSPQWAPDIVNMATEFRNEFPCAVVGVDIAAGEEHFAKDSPFHEAHFFMCQKAQELGINITLHAGETPNSAHNVPLAIKEYGAMRIGHGYHIANNDEIMQYVYQQKTHFEICPTSSVETGGWIKTTWKDHPANTFLAKGVKLSLSSDDPAVFNTDLSWQYRIAVQKMGWSQSDVLRVLEDTVDASFAPEKTKTMLLEMIRSYQLGPSPNFRDRVYYN